MGIAVEFNPDLCLRDKTRRVQGRFDSECLPKELKIGEVYDFLKTGQRNYWLHEQIPLRRTDGNGNLSRPLASVRILEETHFLFEGDVYTKGKYQVINVFDENSPEVHFEGFERRDV